VSRFLLNSDLFGSKKGLRRFLIGRSDKVYLEIVYIS
jgi:hypothetical protein